LYREIINTLVMKQIFCTVMVCWSGLTVAAQGKNFIDQPYLEVTGSADTLLIPNEIYLRIVLAEADSRDRVPIERREAKMVELLEQLGIEYKTALSTSDFFSNYKTYLLRSKEVVKSKTYSLKLSDAALCMRVMVGLEGMGIANASVNYVSHSNLPALRLLLRTQAVENAKQRALALTRPLGQSLGPAIHITDTDAFANQLHGKVPGVQIKIRGTTSISADNVPTIEFEKIALGANVNVKFVLKP
jgi:uncharacterized protein